MQERLQRILYRWASAAFGAFIALIIWSLPFAILGFGVPLPAEAPPARPEPAPPWHACLVTALRIIDADTVQGDLHLGWHVVLNDVDLRADYDAWESTRRRRTFEISEDELVRGQAATVALEKLLADSDGLYVLPPTEDAKNVDPYGRLAGTWYVRDGKWWIKLAKWAKDNGHLRGAALKSTDD